MNLPSSTSPIEEVSLESLGATTPTEPNTAIAGRGKQASGVPSTIEEKAISLLGAGVTAEQTANALGVSPSRISQLLSERPFSDKVTSLRYDNLQSFNLRDGKYDSLEDALLDKLEKSLPLMMRPAEILKSLQVVNAAKRRGQSAPTQVAASQTVVNLVLPTMIKQKFSTNVHNQVVSTGEQDLLTIQSSKLLSIAESTEEEDYERKIKTSSDFATESNSSNPEAEGSSRSLASS